MRKLWSAAKVILPTIPFILQRNNQLADQEDLRTEIETSVDKMFLSSEPSEFSDLKIFAFDAEILGKEVVSHLDTTLGRHVTGRFSDGQIGIEILEQVRDHRVFIIKSFENKDINDGIMQLILAVSCMKKCGAESVTAIIPFFPYSTASSASQQEEIHEGFDFHTCFASDIVKMLESVGCDQIVTLNSLISHPKGFAQTSSFINVEATEIAVPYLIRTKLDDPVLIGTESTRQYLRNIARLESSFKEFNYKCDYGFFNKNQYIGTNVKNRDVVLYNSLVRTGNSIKREVKILKEKGARRIYCYGFHGLCSNDLFEDLINSLPIQELIMTNTIYHAKENKKIRMISVAKLLAQIITLLHDEKPLVQYRQQRQMLHYAYLQKIKSLNMEKNNFKMRMEDL